MTFDQYLDAVFEDFLVGGVTWGQAYMRVLEKQVPELAAVVKTDPMTNPATNEAHLAGFIYYVRSTWHQYPVNRPKPKGPTEGWGEIRPGDRKAHYYREHMALCRKVGFYREHLEPDDEGSSPADCAACRKLLDKEKAKQPAESVTA